MTNDQIEKLRELDKAATPGPWTYDGMHSEIHAYESVNGAFLIVSELREHLGDKLLDEFGHAYNPNFELIAEMRNALPELLKAYDERDALLRAIDSAKPCQLCDSWSVCRVGDMKICGDNGFQDFMLREPP